MKNIIRFIILVNLSEIMLIGSNLCQLLPLNSSLFKARYQLFLLMSDAIITSIIFKYLNIGSTDLSDLLNFTASLSDQGPTLRCWNYQFQL